METLELIKRTSGITKSRLLLAECRRTYLNHSQPYIFDESNHDFITYELEERAKKGKKVNLNVQFFTPERLEITEKLTKIFRCIIQNKQRMLSEILLNSASDRVYIQYRLEQQYKNTEQLLKELDKTKASLNADYINAV